MYKIFILFLTIFFIGCSKGGDSPAPPKPPVDVVEPSLAATNGVIVDIDPGPTNIYGAIGASQKIEVKFAAMPANGVTIDTKLINSNNNDTTFSNSIGTPVGSTTLIYPVTITGMLPNVIYNLRVLVKSKTNPNSNNKTIEFKMATK
jgi:hypothetical protein